MSTIQLLGVDEIRGRSDARPLDDGTLAQLEASIPIDGLINPIRVRRVADGYEVVAGHHRLAAHELLGRRQIEAIIIEASDIQAEMAMLAENICRAELTALERDIQLARWMELSKLEVLAQVEPKPSGGRPEGGVRAAARELGINRNDARRATQVASLSIEAKQTAREIGLDSNRTALLKAAREREPERQAEVLREHARQREQPRGGIAARFAPSIDGPADQIATWHRFIEVADQLEGMPVASIVAGAQQSGSNGRAQLAHRAGAIADRMDGIREALS